MSDGAETKAGHTVTLLSFSIYINLPMHVCCNNKELKPAFLTDCIRGNALLV